MLRRIFGPKRDEVIGSRRKLHNLSARWGLKWLLNHTDTRVFKFPFFKLHPLFEMLIKVLTIYGFL
jgi:hypothetical protein